MAAFRLTTLYHNEQWHSTCYYFSDINVSSHIHINTYSSKILTLHKSVNSQKLNPLYSKEFNFFWTFCVFGTTSISSSPETNFVCFELFSSPAWHLPKKKLGQGELLSPFKSLQNIYWEYRNICARLCVCLHVCHWTAFK